MVSKNNSISLSNAGQSLKLSPMKEVVAFKRQNYPTTQWRTQDLKLSPLQTLFLRLQTFLIWITNKQFIILSIIYKRCWYNKVRTRNLQSKLRNGVILGLMSIALGYIMQLAWSQNWDHNILLIRNQIMLTVNHQLIHTNHSLKHYSSATRMLDSWTQPRKSHSDS